VQPIQLRKIILTHHHIGHVGGLAEIKRRSGAATFAHIADAPYIAGKRPRRLPRHPVERAFHTAVARVGLADPPGVEIDRRLEDDSEINGWHVVHTPGHTPGHICLLRDKFLISGDLLQASAGGFREMPEATTSDVVTCRASIRRVATLEFDVIMPGHNPPYVLHASDKVRDLAVRLEASEV
jgi:glyoxylase-like metal-dependent hydrolase (beta-lactamase superfamily II)